jgi:putative membrane protein
VSAACLFVTSLVGGALGALMSFSQSPWYPDYAAMGMTGIGLDPVDDQRLAGLIMWIPGGLVHGIAALVMFYKWLKAAEGAHAVTLH